MSGEKGDFWYWQVAIAGNCVVVDDAVFVDSPTDSSAVCACNQPKLNTTCICMWLRWVCRHDGALFFPDQAVEFFANVNCLFLARLALKPWAPPSWANTICMPLKPTLARPACQNLFSLVILEPQRRAWCNSQVQNSASHTSSLPAASLVCMAQP